MALSVIRGAAACCTLAFLASCAAPGQTSAPYTPASAGAARASGPMEFIIGATQDPGGIFTFNRNGDSTRTPGFASAGFTVGITYDPENKFVYAISVDAVHAYTRQGVVQTLPGTFSDSHEPVALAYDPENHLIYLANQHNNGRTGPGSMYAYNEYGVQQVAPHFRDVPGDPEAMTCDPSTGTIYVTGFDAGVTAYSVKGKKLPYPFPNTNAPVGIAFDDHNGLVYVADSGLPGVTVYTKTGVQVKTSGTWSGTSSPTGLAFDPQTKLIYITDYTTGQVTAYDEQGNEQTLTGFSGMSPSLGIGPIAIVRD